MLLSVSFILELVKQKNIVSALSLLSIYMAVLKNELGIALQLRPPTTGKCNALHFYLDVQQSVFVSTKHFC